VSSPLGVSLHPDPIEIIDKVSIAISKSRSPITKMSNSLSAPWIKRSVLDVLLSQDSVSRPSRICQVTSVDEKLQQITISDTQSEIVGYITEECVASILVDCESLKNLKYCIIKLESYQFSTVLQCCGNRNAAVLAKEMKTRPLVLQITKLSSLGASDSTVIGYPCGVGENPDVRHHFSRSLAHWSDLLVARQFPSEHSLPDYSESTSRIFYYIYEHIF
jgi:hypothetical protein